MKPAGSQSSLSDFMHMFRGPGRRPLPLAPLLTALLLAACGGAPPAPATPTPDSRTGQDLADQFIDEVFGGGQRTPGQPGGPGATPGAPQLDDRTVTVGLTAWNYAFEWEVLEATLSGEVVRSMGHDGRRLSVRVRVTNHGPEERRPRGEVAALVDQGGQLRGATTDTVWANGGSGVSIPAGASAEGELRFTVQPDFDLDHAFLLIGKRDENQAVVPLGSSGPPLVDLAPYVADIVGELARERFDLALRHVRVSADRWHDNGALPRGTRTLYLHFDFTHRSVGRSSLAPPSFELVLPDGTRATPASWGPNFAGLDPGLAHSLWLRFPLPSEQVVGDYTVEFSPSPVAGVGFRAADDPATLALEFAVTP